MLKAALIAMDDFEKAERIWETIRYSRVMDVDDELVEQLKTSGLKDIAALGLSELIPAAKKVLKDRGFDIAPLLQPPLKKWLMRKKYETLKKSCM